MLTIAVLGPFEVSVDGAAVAVPTGRLRALLACLAMAAGEAVSVEQLAAAAWDGDMPESLRRAVQLYITRLRSLLGKDLIDTRSAGYALLVPASHVDALRFLGLLDSAAAESDWSQERKLLGEALALWRGNPFEGVYSSRLEESEGPWLTERYLSAVERRIDLDIADGRAADIVAELAELAAEHPLRETLWVRWLVALADCNRQAEALARYETVRSLLAEELGADPGPELRAVHADLLAGRVPSALGGSPARRRIPRQLPTDILGFIGRRSALQELTDLFAAEHGSADNLVVISSISGMAGIGKSALAIRAAHRLRARFPDGQLYVDLQGTTPGLQPLKPSEVLGRFLRALGMAPSAVPASESEASARFRSEVAGRRMLILLDNAADAGQIRPLLPGSGCGVLVTSRHVLSALDGAHHLHLDALKPREAVDLLRKWAGPSRVAAEPEATAEIARLCGRLPLALRIAGARLAARPCWSVRAMAERLDDVHHRLDELEIAELDVRASFAVSFEQLCASHDPLDRSAARTFGLLGILEGPDVTTVVVARLLDSDEAETERALERLVDAQLLAAPASGRYRLHDLLRLYAREVAHEQHTECARAVALTRAFGFYVATAWHTLKMLHPGDYRLAGIDERWRKGGLGFSGVQAALGWLEAERANLLAAVQQAGSVRGVPAEIAVQLAQAMFAFQMLHSYWDDQIQVNQIALRITSSNGDRVAEAQAHNNLGAAYERQGQYQRALASLQEGLAIRRELGDQRGIASSLNSLSGVHMRQERYEQALASLQESLAIRRELGDQRDQAISLSNFSLLCRQQGRDEEALASEREALALFQKLGDRPGRAHSLIGLGEVYLQQDRNEEALAAHQESLAICRELSDREGQAWNLNGLGILRGRQGRYDEALACHQESLAIRRELGALYDQAESLRELGITMLATGRPLEARQHWLEALSIFESLQSAKADHISALLRTADQRSGLCRPCPNIGADLEAQLAWFLVLAGPAIVDGEGTT